MDARPAARTAKGDLNMPNESWPEKAPLQRNAKVLLRWASLGYMLGFAALQDYRYKQQSK